MFRIFVAEVARTVKVPVSLNTQADEPVMGSWKNRAATIGSFYDDSKTW